MPDPQWRKQETRREEDQVTIFLERGNNVQGLMRFSNGANGWTMAIYDAESGECLPVNDDVLECRSENGEINACYAPRSHEAIVQLSGPGGARISLPMCSRARLTVDPRTDPLTQRDGFAKDAGSMVVVEIWAEISDFR